MDPKLPAGKAGEAGKTGTLAGEVLQEDVQVSPEVRARILRQIDQVMAEGRRPAEGRLLEVFGRQSESRLQEEQAQAQEAQERLRASELSLAQRLREREQDLRRSMDAELKAERERLNARGLAVSEVEARLRALEAERQAALAAEWGRLRPGLRLQEMADARDQERLVGDRIRAALAQTLQRLQDDELAGARGSLAGLKAILGEPVMQENLGLRDRLPVDLLVAEALTELIARRSQPEAAAGGGGAAAGAG